MSLAVGDTLSTRAIWLDLTRTLTRAGRGSPTGIDRVELAWFDHLAAVNPGLLCLCRTTRGFLLLPPVAARAIVEVIRGRAPLGRADLWSRLLGRGAEARDKSEALLRGGAVDRCTRWGLAGMIRRHSPAFYLNVGHANLSDRTLAPLATAGCRIMVLIHDMIPLTHPQLVPPAQPDTFAKRIAAVRDRADLVVAVSHDTKGALEAHWAGRTGRPPVAVSPIGVPEMPRLDPSERDRRRFLMIGTLEPRKNHATMLEAWAQLATKCAGHDMPSLHIVGTEGWQGAEIRHQIEAHPLHGTSIFRTGGANDQELAEQMRLAGTLLYPSLAEGFGLPPWEALDAGLLPICSDLPVLREQLGTHAVYVDPTDVYSWVETIEKRISGKSPNRAGPRPDRPDWQGHFERISQALGALE